MHRLLVALTLTYGVWAQSPVLGSITGIVRDADSGQPLRGARIYLTPEGKSHGSGDVDVAGRYFLSDVPPGKYDIQAWAGQANAQGSGKSRTITLKPGQALDGIDFRLSSTGSIEGELLDEDKKPVPHASIEIFQRVYQQGVLQLRLEGNATSDASGQFRFDGLRAGAPYLFGVRAKPSMKPDAPGNPNGPESSAATTFYQSAAVPDDAADITLSPGENRRSVSLRQLTLPAFCAEGRVEGAADQKIDISTSERNAASDSITSETLGQTGPEGKFRICNLHRGVYEFNFKAPKESGLFFERLSIAISRESVQNIKVGSVPRGNLSIKVNWPDGKNPAVEFARFWLIPDGLAVGRMGVIEAGTSAPQEVLSGVYVPMVHNSPRGFYIKEIIHGGQTVPGRRITIMPPNDSLQVSLAGDGSQLSATVLDHDANPIGDANIALAPANVSSLPELAGSLITGQTDQFGRWTSETLAPGKYFVLATNDRVDMTAHRINKLWSAWSRAKEIDIAPSASLQLKLEPVSIQ